MSDCDCLQTGCLPLGDLHSCFMIINDHPEVFHVQPLGMLVIGPMQLSLTEPLDLSYSELSPYTVTVSSLMRK